MQNADFSKQAATFLQSKHLPFIGGKFVEIGSATFKVDDGATGEVIAEVLDGGFSSSQCDETWTSSRWQDLLSVARDLS